MRRAADIDPAMLCCERMRIETDLCADRVGTFKIRLDSWHRQNIWCAICDAKMGNVLCVVADGTETYVTAYQIEIDEGEFHD